MPFDSSPQKTITPVARTLFAAADLIRHLGLAKDIQEDEYGNLCPAWTNSNASCGWQKGRRVTKNHFAPVCTMTR